MENVNARMSNKKYQEKVYFDPQFPGSFAGVDILHRAVGKEWKLVLGKANIRKWLQAQDTFGLHREINRKLRSRKVIAPFINYQWDVDTANFKSFTKVNNGYLLSIGHRRFLSLCANVPTQNYPGERNNRRLEIPIWRTNKTHETEDRQGSGVPK